MQEFVITSPEGNEYIVEAPDGATQEQAMDFFMQSNKRSGSMGFFNKSLAKGLGLPVDLVAGGLRHLGFPANDPIGGSKSFEKLFRMSGAEVAKEKEKPVFLSEKIASGAGEATSMIIPGTLAVKTLSKGKGIVGSAADDILQYITKKPVSSTTTELISGAGAGAGAHAGKEIGKTYYPDDPSVQSGMEATGAILGGLGSGLASEFGKEALKYPIKKVGSGISKTVAPFTEKGAMPRATKRIQELVLDKDRALKALDEPTIADLTPAQRTGERGLLGLEQKIAKEEIGIAEALSARTKKNQQVLEQLIEPDVSPGQAKEFLENFQSEMLDNLTKAENKSLDRIKNSIAGISTTQRESQSSLTVRRELQKAFDVLKKKESALWEKVPKELSVSTQNSKQEYRDILSSLSKAQSEDIPSVAKRLLSKDSDLWQDAEPLKELQGLRSKLLEQSRLARSEGQLNKARISDKLADAVFEDIKSNTTDSSLQDAIKFTRDIKERFNRGSVADLFGFEKTGGKTIDPTMTLASTVGAGGVKGNVSFDELLKASDTPELREGVEQYLLSQLESSAIKNGQLNPLQAKKFVKKNIDILDKFPSRKQQILDAIKITEEVAKNPTAIDSNLALVSKYIKSPIGNEIKTVLDAGNPKQAAINLKKVVLKDKTGKAYKGLKSAFVEHMIDKSRKDGEIAADVLLAQLKNKRNSEVMPVLLGQKDVSRLKRVANELQKIQTKEKFQLEGIVSDKNALETVARIIGAKIGSAIGGGDTGASLQVAQIFSGKARNFVRNITRSRAEKILIQAIQDPTLMKALLTNTTSTQGQKLAVRRLNAWLATPIGKTFSSEEEDVNRNGKD